MMPDAYVRVQQWLDDARQAHDWSTGDLPFPIDDVQQILTDAKHFRLHPHNFVHSATGLGGTYCSWCGVSEWEVAR